MNEEQKSIIKRYIDMVISSSIWSLSMRLSDKTLLYTVVIGVFVILWLTRGH